jgi:uncharacterized membrane protein YdbT with pleckstrin-like domain
MTNKAIQLGEGEEILTIVRRHWFSLAVEGFVIVLTFSALFVGLGIFDSVVISNSRVDASSATFSLSLFTLSFVGLFLWMRFFSAWSDHWLDAWVITNKRVIDIEQRGFFRRTISSFPLDRIQDVTCDTSGVIAMWLHFGDVRIQTASISDDLIMRQVGFPEEVKEHIVTLLPAHGHQ